MCLKVTYRRSIADGRSLTRKWGQRWQCSGNTLDDLVALFRGAQLARHPNGPRKGGNSSKKVKVAHASGRKNFERSRGTERARQEKWKSVL